MKKVILFFLFLSLGGALSVSAQQATDSFSIRVFGDIDSTPPSIPVLTSATPVTATQINLIWNPATDDFMVAGYVLFRDDVLLATTTLTTYSDTGLIASTSYSYRVKAFDPSFNYSSSSNLLTATTPAQPIVPTFDESSNVNGTAARVVLDELQIKVGVSTSTFFVKTARAARFEIRWGRTNAYELGSVINNKYSDTYATTLTDLEPGTTYEYTIIGYTQFGTSFTLKQGQFKTLASGGSLVPANVNAFTASVNNNDVQLSWTTPKSAYEYIRIVRNNRGFPTHIQDGAVVYQGRADKKNDENILTQFSPAYYTLFVVDPDGNISSGAVAIAYARDQNQTGSASFPGDTLFPDDIQSGEGTASTSSRVPPGTRMPDLSEIFFLQEKGSYSFSDADVSLSSIEPFTLSIPKKAVSENLKTIIVSLTNPTDSRETYSFLLRLNKDMSAYEAVLSPVLVAGLSQVTIHIYDYSSLIVATYKKTINFVDGEDSAKTTPIFPDLIIKYAAPLSALVLVPSLLLFVGLIFYRRRHGLLEDKK